MRATEHRIGRVDEIPEGRGKVYRVADREIVVFRVGGEFHAVERLCASRHMPLERATVADDELFCPWHGWRFDLRDGRCSLVPDEQTPIFPIRVEGDDLLVTL